MKKPTIAERAAIKLVVLQWKLVSLVVGKAVELVDRVLGGRAAHEGARRFKAYRAVAKDPKKLLSIFQNAPFTWTPDPADGMLNTVFPFWFTMFREAGDCDDGALIVNMLRGGKVWVLGTKIQSTDSAGHVICVDRDGYLWSHNRGTDMAIIDQIGCKDQDIYDNAKRALKRWRYLVELDLQTFKTGRMYKR